MPRLTAGNGLVTPGELQILARPRDSGLPVRYGVMYTHGAGAGADIAQNYANQTVTVNTVTRAGVYGVSGDYGGPQTWGNAKAMSAMTDAYNWLQNQPKVRKGKVSIVGGSMGGLNALVWAAANLDKVACISMEIPVIDLAGIWSANISGFRPLINEAYGGAYNLTLNTVKDPLTMASNGVYNGVPILINYGNTDAICLPEKTEEFLANVPTAEGYALDGGHAESTQLQVNRTYQANFILSHS